MQLSQPVYSTVHHMIRLLGHMIHHMTAMAIMRLISLMTHHMISPVGHMMKKIYQMTQ